MEQKKIHMRNQNSPYWLLRLPGHGREARSNLHAYGGNYFYLLDTRAIKKGELPKTPSGQHHASPVGVILF